MKFDKYPISDKIKRNIEKLGYKKPTDIQYRCIPAILKGEDVLAIAQTGTGKTAAFVIPILEMLENKRIKGRPDGIRAVVMVPTRELALQIRDVFLEFSKGTRVTVHAIYGGVDQDPQIKKLESGVDVLIATPGRLFDLHSQGYVHLRRVNYLVLDEADHMLDLGFIKDIRDLMHIIPRRRQTLFFSATINDKIKKLAYSLVINPIRIQISPKDPVAKNVKHSVIYLEMDDKRFFLERLINENIEGKLLAFVRTQVRADRVVKAMERVDITALALHGGKEKDERLATLNAFRSGEVKVLIATDVSARGIDIPDVDIVVNYDLPELSESYVHRVGRTGRGRNKGLAYSFCSPEEKPILEEIQKFLGKQIHHLEIDVADYKETLDFTKEKPLTMDGIISDLEQVGRGKRKKRKKTEKRAKGKK